MKNTKWWNFIDLKKIEKFSTTGAEVGTSVLTIFTIPGNVTFLSLICLHQIKTD